MMMTRLFLDEEGEYSFCYVNCVNFGVFVHPELKETVLTEGRRDENRPPTSGHQWESNETFNGDRNSRKTGRERGYRLGRKSMTTR